MAGRFRAKKRYARTVPTRPWSALLAVTVAGSLPAACTGDDVTLEDRDASIEALDATVAPLLSSDASSIADVSVDASSDAGGPLRIFPSEQTGFTFPGCIFGSPQIGGPAGSERVIVASNDGTLAALYPDTGNLAWSMKLPVPDGDSAYVLATPAIVGDTAFVSYSTISGATGQRDGARVVGVDLAHHVVDPSFPPIDLAASVQGSGDAGTVSFLPSHQVDRSPVVFARPDPVKRGLLYVAFGNIRDIQPWHGWLFEIDLDQWHDGGAAHAISSVLVDTPENDCPVYDQGGSRDQICGGGLWAPAGPEPTVTDAGLELLAVAGNGQLDLSRRDYANTMMRLRPGLAFDPGCDSSCYDGGLPSRECMETCTDLFVPRMPDGGPLAPTDEGCAGLSFFDCYRAHDWDLGADGPTRVTLKNGRDVIVLAGKDGGLYLVDAAHLGTLYDRVQLAAPCGAPSDPCIADWAGMMVTKPEVVWQPNDDAPLVLVPTLEFDHTHSAGVVGVRVVTDDGGAAPRFEEAWRAPPVDDAEAKVVFRTQPTLPRIAIDPENGAVVWIVDVSSSPAAGHGLLFQIRARDGKILSRTTLAGNGQRYARPLVWNDTVFAISCASDSGPGMVESYRIHP